MARQPRFFVPGVPQHIVQRGNDRGLIVRAEGDCRFLLNCLTEASRLHGLKVYAYVLMTNHLHVLATPDHATSLPSAFQAIGRRYVPYFNKRYGRTGALWEGRYRAAVVESERYFLTCMKYIELNPVRAGLARHPAHYRWSSYGANALDAEDTLVTHHELYERLGQSRLARATCYRQLFDSDIPAKEIDAIRTSTRNNWALGGRTFRGMIETVSGRRAAPTRNGPGSKSDRRMIESGPAFGV